MTLAVDRLRVKARNALAAARHDLAGGYPEAAANRTYYAAFHMARAALLLKEETPKSHKGVQRRFLLHFVGSGRLQGPIAAALSRAARMREEADYDDGALIEAADAEALLADVERFVDALELLITEHPGADSNA